jgi:hypothetical protein
MLTVTKKKNHPRPPPNRKQTTASGGGIAERKDIKFVGFRCVVEQRKQIGIVRERVEVFALVYCSFKIGPRQD